MIVSMTDGAMDGETRALLRAHGFDPAAHERLARGLSSGSLGPRWNRVEGEVTPPAAGDVVPLPPPGHPERARLAALGEDAIARGRVGTVVLAGGMATRFGGVVKAAVEVVDGASFLDVKLADVRAAAREAAGRVSIYLMASFATEDEVRRLGALGSTKEAPVETFTQLVALRMTPTGELFREADGRLSPYAPGHGDLTFALRRSGVLRRFREAGGEILFMSNVDNVAATLDPAVIGAHVEGGCAITVECAPKEPGDKGGAPARVDGRVQIVESFRFPETFDQDSIPVFNTNTLVFDAAAIDRDFDLTWFAVAKKVEGADVIQCERLVGELTALLPSRFLRVERDGPDGRFQPVKDPDELAQRRGAIREILRARGIL